MATREELVARRGALQLELETALVRVASGDRSKQWDPAARERALARLEAELLAMDALERAPMIRQIRVSSSRGY